jgi:predicted RNA-binding protein
VRNGQFAMSRNGSGTGTSPAESPERTARLIESQDKYLAPFELDVTLRAYSPQENVDLLTHPRVAQWIDWMASSYTPNLPDGKHVWLFVPCTKTKPYV